MASTSIASTAVHYVAPPSKKDEDSDDSATSCRSFVTDFDNLTSPGAQAEMDDGYMRAVFGFTCEEGASSAFASMSRQDEDPLRARTVPYSSGASILVATDTDCEPSCYSHDREFEDQQGNQSSSYIQFGFSPYMVPFEPLVVPVYNGPMSMPCMELPPQEIPLVQGSQAVTTQSHHALKASTAACEMHDYVFVDGCGKESSNAEADGIDYEDMRWSAVNDVRTTLILRNLPNDYTREMLLELLDSAGFQATYDFVYLPLHIRRMIGLGYAFVNMINHGIASDVMQKLNGFSNWKSKSRKTLEVDWCKPTQGLKKHLQRWRDSPVMHPDMPAVAKPVLFQGGIQVDFPPPTKQLLQPRMIRRAAKKVSQCMC